MKNILYILILYLVIFSLQSCKRKYATVEFKLFNISNYGSVYNEVRDIEIYDSNDSLIKHLHQKHEKMSLRPTSIPKIKLNKLGIYTLKYRNTLDQPIIKNIIINNYIDYSVSIPTDTIISEYYESLARIKLLDNKEHIKYIIESNGCFKSFLDSFIVEKNNNNYYLIKNGIKHELNSFQYSLIVKFEAEMNMIPNLGDCTNTDNYSIIYMGEEREYHDETCCWNGWENLMYNLKLDSLLH